MSVEQIEKELLKQTKGLSEAALMEVIDFARFLKSRQRAGLSIKQELSVLSGAQLTHLDEEFKDYKSRFPRE